MSSLKNLPLTPLSSIETTDFSISSVSHWKHWMVSIQHLNVSSYSGLFALGLTCGAVAAFIIDRRLKEENSFKEYPKLISKISILVLGVTAIGLIVLANKSNGAVSIAFTILAAGFVLGLKMAEYYIDKSDRRIVQVAQTLQKEKGVWFFQHRGSRYSYELSLSKYSPYFKSLDLKKLLTEFHKRLDTSNRPTMVLFNNMDLTDLDLKRLGEAGWLDNLSVAALSNNPNLTAKGLMLLGSKSSQTLRTLDLSYTKLTDNDFQQMAESGYFNNVSSLILCNNSNITAKGLLEVGKRGFSNLVTLDISDNAQFTGLYLQDWMSADGFAKLEALELRNTNLTEKDLEVMIERSAWVRNLKGLNLILNPNFRSFPPNILQLTNLTSKYPNGCFDGRGIFLDHLVSQMKATPGFIELGKDRKLDIPSSSAIGDNQIS